MKRATLRPVDRVARFLSQPNPSHYTSSSLSARGVSTLAMLAFILLAPWSHGMPEALLRACPGDGGTCPELVSSGRCPAHTRQAEARRGSATSRGYNYHWSHVFRPLFSRMLIAAGIAPVCGAALPGGPAMADSQCKAAGRLVADHLHLDHDPPLRPEERHDRRSVEDPLRVGWLCTTCHNARTRRQMNAGVV